MKRSISNVSRHQKCQAARSMAQAQKEQSMPENNFAEPNHKGWMVPLDWLYGSLDQSENLHMWLESHQTMAQCQVRRHQAMRDGFWEASTYPLEHGQPHRAKSIWQTQEEQHVRFRQGYLDEDQVLYVIEVNTHRYGGKFKSILRTFDPPYWTNNIFRELIWYKRLEKLLLFSWRCSCVTYECEYASSKEILKGILDTPLGFQFSWRGHPSESWCVLENVVKDPSCLILITRLVVLHIISSLSQQIVNRTYRTAKLTPRNRRVRASNCSIVSRLRVLPVCLCSCDSDKCKLATESESDA